MPTEADFRAAAGAMRTLSTVAGSSAVAVNDANLDIGMSGGRATDVVVAAMNAAFLNSTAVSDEASAAADELDRRARACADYTQAMQRWRADLDAWQGRWTTYLSELSSDPDATPPGARPGEPARWPLWVEEG